MEERTEKPVVFAVMTLFLTFVVVYMVFFRKESDIEKQTEAENGISPLAVSGSNNVSWLVFSGYSSWFSFTGDQNPLSWSQQNGWVSLSTDSSNVSWVVSWFSSETNLIQDESLDSLTIMREKISTLSGVSLWYNSIKIAETLALDVKSAFTDTGSVLYGYLGTGSIDDSKQIIKRLWWNTVEIETENDIIKNLLRWDRVVFINIPWITFLRKWTTEQKLLVTMVVEIDEDRRLIQSPVDRYYSSKKRIKQIFESLYNKPL